MARPLYPEDGFLYDVAMMEAEKEYNEWVKSRKGKRGIVVYTRKQEDADAHL